MVTAQSVATIIAALIQVAVQYSLFTSVEDICTEKQASHLICPHNTVYYTASAIWFVISFLSDSPSHGDSNLVVYRGLIGPTRQFGAGALYKPELYALAFGALIPIPFWLWQRRFPKTRLKYISMPVLLNGPSLIPPATGINYSSWFIVAFVFRELI